VSEETKPEVCRWVQDGDGADLWESSCRGYFRIDDGTPSENGMKFCCYCGKPLEESPWVEEEGEE